MLELSIYDNLLLTLLSFFTAMMTSIAGAGGGTVLLAAMLQFMNPSEAIPVHGVIQFTSNIARTWLLRKFVKWSIILKFSLMIPLGVYIGLEIFQSINAEDIKKLIGSFIIIALILQNIKFIKNFIISSNWYYIVGLFTGILNILVGVIAPLLAVIVKQSINEKINSWNIRLFWVSRKLHKNYWVLFDWVLFFRIYRYFFVNDTCYTFGKQNWAVFTG